MTNGVAGKGHVVLSEDTPRFPRAATKLKLDPVLMEHTGVYGKLGTQRVVLISIIHAARFTAQSAIFCVQPGKLDSRNRRVGYLGHLCTPWRRLISCEW